MDTLSYKTQSATPATIEKQWVVIDATDQVLGRLCSKVAKILRGKYKPDLAVKLAVAVAAGFVIDLAFCGNRKDMQIEHLCEQHHCHCENGIWKSALHHMVEIFVYILLISLALNLLIAWIGEETLGGIILNRPVVGTLLAGLVGLIPNCAASVAVTQLYLDGVLGAGGMLAGLLSGSGVGLLVLLKVNDDWKENLRVIGLLYAIGVAAGIVVELSGITF